MSVVSYSGYFTNGYYFYTKTLDDRSTVQNSGVTLVAQEMHISSVKEKKSSICNHVILWGDRRNMVVRLYQVSCSSVSG